MTESGFSGWQGDRFQWMTESQILVDDTGTAVLVDDKGTAVFKCMTEAHVLVDKRATCFS